MDSDTPAEFMTTKSLIDGSTYHLVMSDEFNVPGRDFSDGSDPMWTALDKSDDDANAAGGGSLHFYNSTTVTTTEKGELEIKSVIGQTEWEHYDVLKKKYRKITKQFRSGMVQSWNKFCFTGGIVELDMIFPGVSDVGGLWPAAWILGNLGRATYEASTNNIWPWSYDTCNRDLQQAQTISACNTQNHYGLVGGKGRGATEIDIIEVMAGKGGKLDETVPPIEIPYVDMTLQVAPGITRNRPTEGYQPVRKTKISTETGHIQSVADNWYDIELHGNTSLNPFFYGTYLGETKPEEPVQRTKYQAFQADAVGAMHQIGPSHFQKMHSYRLEWQPGRGGRLDWFVKKPMKGDVNGTLGDGTEWQRVVSITDEAVRKATGAQIPIEPSYLIFNTAISSTWGFPYSVPSWCKTCFDCSNPECWCNFNPGFCQMMERNVSFLIDFVRVYQSHNSSAHPGANHTVGCDPEEFPTKEFIRGHAHIYTRPPPFGYADYHPLKQVVVGGGDCETDTDCGGFPSSEEVIGDNETDTVTPKERKLTSSFSGPRGRCIPGSQLKNSALHKRVVGRVCECHEGFTGPNCLAEAHSDDTPGAYDLHKKKFADIVTPVVPKFLGGVLLVLVAAVLIVVVVSVKSRVRSVRGVTFQQSIKKPEFRGSWDPNLKITGRSV